jgi:SAM-dependent methyltransferase
MTWFRWLIASLVLLPFLALPALHAGEKAKKGKKEDKEEPKYANLTFVPTAEEVIDKMIEMGKVTKADVVFDLGCGDCAILCRMAKKIGCKGIGIDINPERVKEAKEKIKKMGVEKLVEVRLGDALKVKDLDKATVVTLYMFPEFLNLWQPIAKKTLKPGARILSHDYAWNIGDWDPDRTETVRSSTREHRVHMWTIGKGKGGKSGD